MRLASFSTTGGGGARVNRGTDDDNDWRWRRRRQRGGEEHTTTQAPVGIKTAVEKKAEEDDPSDNHGNNKNGLIFRPSCSDNCITTQNKKCGHNTTVTVSLNKVGDFVAFPALWIHRGYYRIQSEGTVIFQAQLFAVPSSDIFNSKRTTRSNIAMKVHKEGNFCDIRNVSLELLTADLFQHWDDTHSAEKFPPCPKFQDEKIDKAKNRHIHNHQIHSLPKIKKFVDAFEEIVGGINTMAFFKSFSIDRIIR